MNSGVSAAMLHLRVLEASGSMLRSIKDKNVHEREPNMRRHPYFSGRVPERAEVDEPCWLEGQSLCGRT